MTSSKQVPVQVVSGHVDANNDEQLYEAYIYIYIYWLPVILSKTFFGYFPVQRKFTIFKL